MGKIDFNRFFDQFEDARRQASVDGVFGKPIEADGKTLIPISSSLYGFGMGVGEGTSSKSPEGAETDSGGGLGGGGGYAARPIAMAVVDADGVHIQSILNEERIALAGMLTGAWVIFWMAVVLLRLLRRR